MGKKGQIAWNKGEPWSEESKKKMSIAHKGQAPWNKGMVGYGKGHKVSEEARRKIGEAHRGKSFSEEHKKKLFEHHWSKKEGFISPMKGKHLSKEARAKDSEAIKRKWAEPEYRKKLIEKFKLKIGEKNPFYGKKISEEHRRKLRESHLGKYPSEETRKRLSDASKRNWSSPESRQKKLEALKKAMATPEHKQKLSISSKKMWAKPEYRKKIMAMLSNPRNRRIRSEHLKGKHFSPGTEFKKGMTPWIKGKYGIFHQSEEAKLKLKEARAKQVFPFKDSKPEIKIQKFLRQLNLEFIPHKYIKEIKHSYQCDIFIPQLNLIIEVDGDYWHGNMNNPRYKILNKHQIEQVEEDRIRTKELQEKGFKVLRIWGSEINKMDLKEFMEKIKPFQNL